MAKTRQMTQWFKSFAAWLFTCLLCCLVLGTFISIVTPLPAYVWIGWALMSLLFALMFADKRTPEERAELYRARKENQAFEFIVENYDLAKEVVFREEFDLKALELDVDNASVRKIVDELRHYDN